MCIRRNLRVGAGVFAIKSKLASHWPALGEKRVMQVVRRCGTTAELSSLLFFYFFVEGPNFPLQLPTWGVALANSRCPCCWGSSDEAARYVLRGVGLTGYLRASDATSRDFRTE